MNQNQIRLLKVRSAKSPKKLKGLDKKNHLIFKMIIKNNNYKTKKQKIVIKMFKNKKIVKKNKIRMMI